MRARGNAQQFRGQAQPVFTLNRHRDRDPAVDAITVRSNAEHATACRTLFQHRKVLHDVGEFLDVRHRVRADQRVRHLDHFAFDLPVAAPGAHAGLAHDDARCLERICEDLIVVGQILKVIRQTNRQRRVVLDELARRQAVRFGKHDIEGQGHGPCGGGRIDHRGDTVARPGPLADGFKAFVVDIQNGAGHRRQFARLDLLVDVKGCEAQRLQGSWIGNAQRQTQHETDKGRHTDPADPFREPVFHAGNTTQFRLKPRESS